MTAREKIAFQLGLLGIADDQIEANLDAFAHELAEQQRTEPDGLHEWRQAAYKATRERDQALATIARIEKWAGTTENGRAAAEVMLLLGMPAKEPAP